MGTSTLTLETPASATLPRHPHRILSTSLEYAVETYIRTLRIESHTMLTHWQIREDIVDALVLSLSELYTNVVRHVPAGPCTVTLLLYSNTLRLTVRDSSRFIPPIPVTPETYLLGVDGEGGRGLGMVAAYADRFHFQPMESRYGPGKVAVADWDVAA